MGTRILCHLCNTEAVSTGHRHNFVTCSCGQAFADGGDSYSRFGGMSISLWDDKDQKWVRFNGNDVQENPKDEAVPCDASEDGPRCNDQDIFFFD